MKISKAIQIFVQVGAAGYTARTLELYVEHINRFRDFIGDKDIEKITVINDVIGYRRHLEKRGVSDNTINLSMISLRQMWKTLCGLERELKIELPFLWSAIPFKRGVGARSHKPIEAEDFKKMLDSVNGKTGFLVTRDIAILLTLYHSGMRVSELTALNVSSVNPEDLSILAVTRKRQDNLRYRRIYISKEAMVALSAYIDIRQYYTGSDALFISLSKGSRLSTRSIERIVKEYAKKASLDPTLFKPHGFRHGWGKRAAEAQMYPLHIQAQLGHTNLSGSQVYFNVTNRALKEEVMQKMYSEVEKIGVYARFKQYTMTRVRNIERDLKIFDFIEKKGLSRGQTSKLVGISKPAVSKAYNRTARDIKNGVLTAKG